MHNYNPSCIQLLQKDLWKFTSCMTFGAHKLVHSEPFLDHRCEIWHLLSALCSDMRKNFLHRCTSTVSALNYCSRIFFQNPQLSIRSGAHKLRTNFSADFWTFRNFWPQFRENCGATYRRMWELCSVSESAITFEKKRCKPRRNWPINGNVMRVRTMHPSKHGAPDSERVKKKK